ncbi:MAG: ABC transporter substrate-binding protein [bacterium]|nr:ABC transporter substrate-binding protein [bacterium]
MKIASLSPAVTEILFAFELEEQIVCTDQFSNYPESVKYLPHLKDHQNVDISSLMEFEPELVITSTIIQEKLATQMKDRGLSVVHQDYRTINTLYEGIRELGLILSVEDMAEALVLRMQQGFKDVKRKSGLLPRRPRVYIEEWHQPPMASGNWVPEVTHIAGCEQFPISAGELSREVTLEEVVAFDPDMIVISWCGAGTLVDPTLLKEREGWDVLRAVQDDAIRVIDDSLLNRPGPRLVEGAQRLYGWGFELLH